MTIVCMLLATYYRATGQVDQDDYWDAMKMFLGIDAIIFGVGIVGAVLMSGGH